MPPRRFSRHLFTLGVNDSASPNQLQLTERQPYGYQPFPDNAEHTVLVGDTLWTLANFYFHGTDSAANLWWVIADFQPDPILDPTIALVVGSTLVVPSLRTVLEVIFNANRANESLQ